MKRLRTAVIGVGSLGRHHARIYSNLEESELVAVVDSDLARAREIAAQYGCSALSDFRELAGRVDAVSVAVPTVLHAEVGECCLKQGIHVLVEKPIASNLEEADRLIEAQAASGSVLHIGHTERFNPAMAAVRPLLSNPRFFEAHRLGVFVARSLDIDVVLDLMIHDLDLVLSLTPIPVAEIRAVGIPVLTPRVDIANVRIEFENGCVANLTASRVSKEKVRKFRFFQTNDYISLDFYHQTVEMHSLVGKDATRQIVDRELAIERMEPLAGEIQTFLSASLGESISGAPCTAWEGRRSLECALEIVDQIQSRLSRRGSPSESHQKNIN